MAIPKIIGAQRDFSAGEVDVELKRADGLAAMKAGARQMANYRILNSRAVKNRPGRTALFFEAGRVEQLLMSPGNTFYIAFGTGYLRIYNAAGTKVFESYLKADGVTPIPWTPNGQITYVIVGYAIYIAYAAGSPNNVPQVLTWDGVSQTSTWTPTTYAETVTGGGQKRTPFYRISPPNITLAPSAQTGAINIFFSANVLVAGMVGKRISWCGRQMTITGVTDGQNGTATVNETLPFSQTLPFASSPAGIFSVGDVVKGSASGSSGIVLSVGGGSISVQLIPPNTPFVTADTVVGPGGSLAINAAPTNTAPGAVSLWTDEVFNSFRGYPSSVFYDQGRLGFCNIPAVPSGIVWATIGTPSDIWVDPSGATQSTSSAIFEIAPGKSQVLYVVSGMQSSEFVFCDNAIYFIPISATNPLVPGSVAFTELAAHGCYPNVQPRRAEQTVIYVKAGGISIGAVQAPGATNRPFIIDGVSDFHTHLFAGRTPIAIAIPSASVQFQELYIYIGFADGQIVAGRYSMRNGLLDTSSEGKPLVGWAPWTSAGTLIWLSALGSTLLFVNNYNIGPQPNVVEQLDANQYLDGAVSVNAVPTPLAPALGKGPLWWLAGGSVSLMDQSTRMMGTYQIDANGFIIPQGNAGENLTSSTLVAGQPWTATLEPFVPDAAPEGRSISQRMFKRRVSRMAVYVSNSTGFLLARLFAGPITRTSPPLGTMMNSNRIPAWNQDDDPTQPPPLREEAQRWRPIGRAYDPRVAVIKDTPGPLTIHEIGLEVTI